ncbi:MAG: AAA family ATPase [Candidatus Aminicenantes bacterium]|nr:AAA family ATPase [Candidatus Aminicenantes bacterium]NIM77701.1 AAA family ATPase [Candidatus Aminicenantes bacterium]NIN17014.1 AAA family ATPase [Candidatus Aminicenantes bacterium]NIN40907.1 AAA family ATPase [Candidatus Aminicenantes bacterium]NIN83712.1 AAA family ATPase [Candidatus Aminicenantes bacterium]
MEITPELEANFSKLMISSILPIKLAAKLKGKIGKETKKAVTRTSDKHTETTLRKAIDKLTQKLPVPVVLFIDEMDRFFKTVNPDSDWIHEVIKLLQFTTEIMTNRNLIFIFALQPEIYDIFAKAYRGEGDDSILKYVPAFKKIDGFNIDFARKAVRESLKFAGYKGKIEDLFEEGILETVLSAVKSNPRQFMLSLTDLTILAYKKNQKQVNRPILKEFLLQKFGETGPEEWRKSL